MVIEIVQCTEGAALVIGLIVLLHRLQNRFNRIVHRTIPKTKFPPAHHPNGYGVMEKLYWVRMKMISLKPLGHTSGQS